MSTRCNPAEDPSAIQLWSGGYISLRYPSPEDVNIFDIAAALSKLNRYTGHTREFYSVAQHSVLCSTYAPAHLKMQALLHDAAEAYLGDVSSPLKSLLPDYRVIEAQMEKVIAVRFGFPYKGNDHEIVKQLDMTALATEVRDLMPPSSWSWECLDGVTPLRERIQPLGPQEAEDEFIKTFMMLERQIPPAPPRNQRNLNGEPDWHG